MIKIGDKVDTRFGIATIIGIEICERVGDKYGVPAIAVDEEDKNRCVFDLDNKHWQYGNQITKINEKALDINMN